MKKALFVGRFQPFHLGHLSAVKKVLKENDRVIIVIGSAEQSYLPENPFTAGERLTMIDEALRKEGVPAEKYLIVPVCNINNYTVWPDYVDSLIPRYEKIYTGSPIVKKLYEAQGKHKIADVEKELDVCSTEVRRKMLEDGDWENMVPEAVSELIKKWNGIKRLKEIC